LRVVSGEGGVQPQNDNRTVAVEWALIVHPAVVEAVAQSGAPEEGAPLRVYVVLQDGAAADDAQRAALAAHVEQAMAGDAPPLEFIFVESLPKTRTGKVARWMLGQEDGV
jgi:acetyl-CoA synthetase